MKSICILLSLGLLSLPAQAHAGAQSIDANASLQRTLESRRQSAATAWHNKDAEALKGIMAPDFLFTSPQGTVPREGWLASLSHCSLTTFTMKDVNAQTISEDSATLSYNLHYVGECDGTPVPTEAKVIDTFASREGKWWIVKTNYMPPMPAMGALVTSTPPSDAQRSFSQLKTLGGTWQAHVTTVPAVAGMGDNTATLVTLRVTSRGNAIVHEMKEVGTPDDPAKYDHPVTMLYLDNDRITLTHYCDAGNRPRMVARTSPDGKIIEFDFVDVAGSTQYGHMHHVAFTLIDTNHHTEDWTYMMPGDKPIRAHLDLERAK